MTATPHAGAGESSKVDSVTLHPGAVPRLVVAGAGVAPVEATLAGARLSVTATIDRREARWEATFDLLVSRWRGSPLPPPSGSYRLELRDAAGSAIPLSVTAELLAETLVDGLFRVTLLRTVTDAASSGLTLDLAAPLTDAERGTERQAELERAYRSSREAPLDAVYFESFYGQSASCNPLAIDRALAIARPEIPRYWSVVDASVEVPEGSIAIIEGSAEWWRVRGAARLVVVNDWLRNRFRRRPFQTVLQTWHGTPLKKIALSRPGVGIRTIAATIRERSRWNILLAQNPHSARVFRTAYAFLGPIWQEGYPRDDSLIEGDAAAVRARLGIPDDVTVLLYAPTWRDDRPEHVDHLDVAAFTDALGPGYLTLIRGHSRTLQPGRDLLAHNVLDVTGYPDVSDLFLAADALITDYSSVMFDFSVTKKPIYFFVPDLDHYKRQLRGFYFDLDDAAPGPVVQNAAELVGLVKDREAVRERYADQYREWRQRFNPRDDGRSADRIVARLLARKTIG
jgi:CDP-glycerol glycerophosphotransferase